MCIHQIAKELVRRGHSVTTVCYEDNSTVNEVDGVKIVRIDIPGYLLPIESEFKLKIVLNHVKSIISRVTHLLSYPLRSKKMVRDYEKAVKNILNKKRNTSPTVIASYTPLEAVIAASNIKKYYNLKCVYYSADTISNEQGKSGVIPPLIREYLGCKWEAKLFERFDEILIMECHKNYYFSIKYEKFIKKMKVVNFPLFHISNYKANNVCKTATHKKIIYIGTLYKTLRNPQFVCNCMKEIMKYINFTLTFVGGGDCDDILEQARRDSDQRIDFLGMQTYEIAQNLMASADILLSIGNNESPMAPSKIYEYMSTGKPIIHFYTDTDDPCIIPLSNYGNALLVSEKKEICIKKLIDFISKSKQVDPGVISKHFESSKASFTANYLESL